MECVLLFSLCSQLSVVSLLFILKCLVLSIYSLLCPSPLFLYISQCLSLSLSMSVSLLVGLETQTQNAAFFERKRPERKPWPRGKPLNRKK